MTKYFVQEIPLTTMNLSKFIPYLSSPIYRKLYGTSIREENWERLNGMNFVYQADGFKEEELDREYTEMIKFFYIRSAILW